MKMNRSQEYLQSLLNELRRLPNETAWAYNGARHQIQRIKYKASHIKGLRASRCKRCQTPNTTNTTRFHQTKVLQGFRGLDLLYYIKKLKIKIQRIDLKASNRSGLRTSCCKSCQTPNTT